MIVPFRRKWNAFRTCLAIALFAVALFRQHWGLSTFLIAKDPTKGSNMMGSWRWVREMMGNRYLSDDGTTALNTTSTIQDDGNDWVHRRRVIYSKLRKDQAGWVIYDMLKAHSYAFDNNLTYGGACGDSIHKPDISNVLSSIGWNEILPLACPQNDTLHRVYPGSFFEKDCASRMASMQWREFMINHTDYSYFDHEPREKNGKENQQHDLATKPFSIVVHIRRRDVTPCCYPHWYLPNSYFASMIEKYYLEHNASSRPIQIQIFSQSESHESWDDLHHKIPSHINYTLHLDGPVGEVWRAIVSSDVFLGSISEFSRVPAMFARGLVTNPRNISDGRIASETQRENQRLLEECGETKIFQCKHKWWMKKRR